MGTGWLAVALVWLGLQLLAFAFLHGRWKIAASLSGGAMILAIAVGILGGLAGSNLAPIWIFLALPLCTLWIAGVWVLRGIVILASR